MYIVIIVIINYLNVHTMFV